MLLEQRVVGQDVAHTSGHQIARGLLSRDASPGDPDRGGEETQLPRRPNLIEQNVPGVALGL